MYLTIHNIEKKKSFHIHVLTIMIIIGKKVLILECPSFGDFSFQK